MCIRDRLQGNRDWQEEKTGILLTWGIVLQCGIVASPVETVSYTHLDVYKRQLQGIDCLAFFIRALGVAPRLIFKNQEEAPGNCLTGTDLLNELEVVFLHEQALFIGFLLHLLPHGI